MKRRTRNWLIVSLVMTTLTLYATYATGDAIWALSATLWGWNLGWHTRTGLDEKYP